MAKYRDGLPQLDGKLFLTDGGMETTFIFHQGIDLPCFAAFDLLRATDGPAILKEYYETYLDIAKTHTVGFVLESATWRASRDWAEKLGYSAAELAAANRDAIELLAGLRDAHEAEGRPIVISGCIGPRGDGYDPDAAATPDEAQAYHTEQIRTFAETEADLVSALTMTSADEAIGITRAAADTGIPVVISFTVETDGNLPTGQPLREAIASVDGATAGAPAYYMINCAHPTHFEKVVAGGEPWLDRIGGLRANASAKSHAELDEAEELDDGDPQELAAQYVRLRNHLPKANVLGGCCGTDRRHVEAICNVSLAA